MNKRTQHFGKGGGRGAIIKGLQDPKLVPGTHSEVWDQLNRPGSKNWSDFAAKPTVEGSLVAPVGQIVASLVLVENEPAA